MYSIIQEDELINYFTNELQQGKDKELFVVTKMMGSFDDHNQQNGTVQMPNRDDVQNDYEKSESQPDLPLTFSDHIQNNVEYSSN